ncbi:unnamed protein product, partial [Brenthis ino]
MRTINLRRHSKTSRSTRRHRRLCKTSERTGSRACVAAVAHGRRPPPRTVRPPKAETQRRPNVANTTASAHRC